MMPISKSKKIILFSIGGIVALFVLIAVTLRYFVNTDIYKPRLQAAASEALGMEVSIGGRLVIGFFPGMQLTMDDVHLRKQNKEIVAAKEVRLGIELLPLLRDKFHITHIALIDPKITIERGVDGKYNFQKPQTTEAKSNAVDLTEIALSGTSFLYTDKKSGGGFSADDCDLKLRHLLSAEGGADFMKHVSFKAELHCGKIQTKRYAVTDLKLSADAKNGVIDFKSATLALFGGKGSGSMRADYSGSVPLYNVHYSLQKFRIDELLKTQSPEAIASGTMDFSMDMTLQGKTMQEMKQSATGEAALRGDNLTLNGHDLDLEFSRFESSQNFSLVDMGAFFFAGPVGLAVTKGYDFANVLKGTGGVSHISTFVSQWKVENGVMHAQDVAMATKRYRMALLGGLDIANARFVDVKLVLLDPKGCAEVEQKLNGPFVKPLVEQPNILASIAGPALKLLNKGRKLLPGGECSGVYAGTVASPH